MLYLHIGTHKTGTSALQTFLSHRVDAFKEKGVRYVSTGMGAGRSHHAFPWSLREKAGHDVAVWDALREELSSEPYPINVVSSEAFWFSDPAQVKNKLEGVNDVRIVMYLRRQDKYLPSLYKQSVTGGRKMDFATWTEQYHFRGDYLSVVRQWADQFGADALIIRPYERNGQTIDVIADFLSVLGVEVGEELTKRGGKLRNPSPRRELLQFLRALNHVGLEFNRDKFFWTLIRSDLNYVRSADLLSHEQSVALMQSFAESNKTLSEEFYRDTTAPLFPPSKRAPPPEIWTPDDKEYFDMTVNFLDVLVKSVASGEIKLKSPKKKQKAETEADED